MYPYGGQPVPPPKVRPIYKPGAPRWARSFVTATSVDRRMAAITVGVLGGSSTLGVWLVASPGRAALGVLLLVASWGGFIGTGIAAAIAMRGATVSAPSYVYEGVPIEGEALDLLADIQSRFAWAERMFAQVPTGIRWDDVAEQVEVLMWEAAGQAAKVSALDVERNHLVYANPGTPQAVLRDQLDRRRADLMAQLHETQREADQLAREASNTAAAARVALARTGSVYDLEIASPTGAGLVARGTLAAARARLALLAEVWAELDETNALTAERLGIDEGTTT